MYSLQIEWKKKTKTKKNNISRQHYAKKVYISNMLNNEIWDKNYNF